MRILFGMPSKESRGGPIYCEPPFVAALREAGVEADEEVYVYGSDVSPFARVRRVVEAARRLRRRVRTGEYDVIHLNTSFDEKCVLRDLFTMMLLRSYRVPMHLKMHGSSAAFHQTKSPFWRFLQRRVFAMAADIGVLSSQEREMFLTDGCPAEKLSRAIYSTANEEFKKDVDFRSRHGISESQTILLFSARFIPAKGLLDVIETCSKLKESGHDFDLFCLGDGPQRAEAKEKVAKLGLAENVRFTGYISEAETTAFHANSDIFVFPTYHDEGFPLVLLKSLAAGMPIVTTKIRAAGDMFHEPDNCLWVEPRSPHQLAEKLTQLIDDTAKRKTMSDNNLRLAEQFTPKAVAEHYIDLYKSLSRR
jgi:glycosyltransferase involved in cell wall biosynthesis